MITDLRNVQRAVRPDFDSEGSANVNLPRFASVTVVVPLPRATHRINNAGGSVDAKDPNQQYGSKYLQRKPAIQ
jgi:hypothetical protein